MGRIVGLFGVRGEVKLESWTEPRMRIFDYQPWLLVSAPGREIEVNNVKGRIQGKGLVASLPRIEDRDQAEALVGSEILVERDQLPPAGEGEYYWFDLEGLEVVTESGESLGRVNHLFATGANDVMVVRGDRREHLIPFVRDAVVRSVDLDAGRIVVDWDAEF